MLDLEYCAQAVENMSVIAGFDTPRVYLLLVCLLAVQRVAELVIARRNSRWLKARGGVEVGVEHYPWMVLLHVTFLISCPLEVWFFERPFLPPLAGAMMVLLAVATALRFWALTTLGRRWTTRVICLPGVPRILGGPYRFVRHPNYLAVILELLALPLIHTAWITALVYTGANAVLLRIRIGVENEALARHSA